MPVKKSALPARELGQLREAILDITAVVNSPRPDAALIAAAGVELDRALFPLLSRIERHGALGVKELADFVGRDYTTVSRQVAKLEALDLVTREPDFQALLRLTRMLADDMESWMRDPEGFGRQG